VRFLSGEERERLLAACRKSKSRHLLTVVVLALATGMRQGEILKLKRLDVDLSRGWILLPITKNRQRRGLPITGYALDVLRAHMAVPRLGVDWVFPNLKGDAPATVRRAWDLAIKEAGVENFRFHDCRHSAASALLMSGAGLGEIADILGHRTLAMVQRYSHVADEHRQKVVQRMNEAVFGGEG